MGSGRPNRDGQCVDAIEHHSRTSSASKVKWRSALEGFLGTNYVKAFLCAVC